MWLGRRWTCDREVIDSTQDRVVIKWYVLGWVTVCSQVNLGITNTKVNSAFHPSGVGKSSTAVVITRRVHLCRVAGKTV